MFEKCNETLSQTFYFISSHSVKFKGINGKIKSALQSACIADFGDILRGFADIENNARIVDPMVIIVC